MKYMRKILIISVSMVFLFMIQSCYTTQRVNHCVSLINDLDEEYIGKDKSYIIDEFPMSPTEIKRLDNQYEIIIYKRYRNQLVGYGITKFLLKNGICYKIETNEYKIEQRLEKVSIF